MIPLADIISRAKKGEATIRDGYAILERMQQEIDYLGELIDSLSIYNRAIITRVDETSVRFEDADKMAAWLAGVMQ